MKKIFINKIKVYQNQYKGYTPVKGKYFTDQSGAIYFSDSFSIIKLFDTEYNRKQRNDILTTFEKGEKLNDQILKLFDNFEESDFNIPAEKKGEHTDTFDNKKYCFMGDNNLSFDILKIQRIEKIISGNKATSYFISEKNKNAVCIVGINGVAYLLGCKQF